MSDFITSRVRTHSKIFLFPYFLNYEVESSVITNSILLGRFIQAKLDTLAQR